MWRRRKRGGTVWRRARYGVRGVATAGKSRESAQRSSVRRFPGPHPSIPKRAYSKPILNRAYRKPFLRRAYHTPFLRHTSFMRRAYPRPILQRAYHMLFLRLSWRWREGGGGKRRGAG